MDEKIKFKYYKPITRIIINIVWVIISVLAVYILINNVPFPTAIQILLGMCVLRFLFEYFIGNNLKDLSGMFILRNNNFDILAIKNAKNIHYSDIVEIKKEYYQKTISLIWTSGTQYNAGKYTICLKYGEQYSFCISDKEERTYYNKIKKLEKKIYKTNTLGVHFNTNKFKERIENKENEKTFEQEKPMANFSLENAILKLLKKSETELNDLT